MAKRKYDACVSTGDKPDGKKYWQKVGTVFESDKGLSLKLDVIPLAKIDDKGYPSLWINFFEPRQYEGQQQTQVQSQPIQSAPPVTDPGEVRTHQVEIDGVMTDIPF